MRFDYPVLALINTNVINGHKKQVDSVRLILSKAAPRASLWKRLLLAKAWGSQEPRALPSPPAPLLPLLVFPSGLPVLPAEALPP